MGQEAGKRLEEYLALQYRFDVIADPEGGWVIRFPDLPGCVTQVDDLAEIGAMAEDAKRTWIEGNLELGREIPMPTYPNLEEYSGRFVVRMPRRLHRELAEQARRNDTSLNSWMIYLLSGKMTAEAQREQSGPPRRAARHQDERPKAVNA